MVPLLDLFIFDEINGNENRTALNDPENPGKADEDDFRKAGTSEVLNQLFIAESPRGTKGFPASEETITVKPSSNDVFIVNVNCKIGYFNPPPPPVFP